MPEHEGGGPVCRELQVIGAAEWRTQQEQDSDLQPVLQWVETGQRPPWGRWQQGAPLPQRDCGQTLQLCGCVMGSYRELGGSRLRGENRWRVVVPKAMRRLC
ncbi:hypothetical protein AAFF_G00334380 [Aldrovandia affinis]|uniref:Uncharacterized protein n=1 Tax=Aldrovandia affinis TaxID=143900 RepID=A0AAD7SLG1_9TELE|nr:hypothetical protein AAFF_G00334380 [Aldrovandia affinis]